MVKYGLLEAGGLVLEGAEQAARSQTLIYGVKLLTGP